MDFPDRMPQLLHHAMCPHSRFIRLVAAERGLDLGLTEERVWERRPEFLALNPAGTTPVLRIGEASISGASVIMEYLEETAPEGTPTLLPSDGLARAEVRRLVAWFETRMHAEATGLITHEKALKRVMPKEAGGGAPEAEILRIARANFRYHLRYIGHLARHRHWLAGDALSYADFAAAAHLSLADYLGEVPWDEDGDAKLWYARLKSRPAMRGLLGERLTGILPPPHYADPDF